MQQPFLGAECWIWLSCDGASDCQRCIGKQRISGGDRPRPSHSRVYSVLLVASSFARSSKTSMQQLGSAHPPFIHRPLAMKVLASCSGALSGLGIRRQTRAHSPYSQPFSRSFTCLHPCRCCENSRHYEHNPAWRLDELQHMLGRVKCV